MMCLCVCCTPARVRRCSASPSSTNKLADSARKARDVRGHNVSAPPNARNAERRLPALRDVLDRAYEAAPQADVIVFTNADIAVFPW
jgi:hypothetical protein